MVTRLVPELKLNQNQKVSVCVRCLSEERPKPGLFPRVTGATFPQCGLDQLSEISPSCRDALELWPSVTSPTGIVGREPRFVCPVSVVVSVLRNILLIDNLCLSPFEIWNFVAYIFICHKCYISWDILCLNVYVVCYV